ncbi:MAG TPA: hypothetical protein VFM14_13730 [Gemmatimonadales bacterium]|nr:hypothetical protein [Gemmatimonadales bacterium]
MARNFWTRLAGVGVGLAGWGLVAGPAAAQIQAATGQFMYAVYDGQRTAETAFGGLRDAAAADSSGAYAVVAKDLSGQVTIQEQLGGTLGRAVFLRGLTALLGPSGGQGDAGTTGLDTLRAALTPGSSGIFALVDPGRMEPIRVLLESTSPRLLGVTVVAPTTQSAAGPSQGIRASPPVQSSATGYTPGTDYEPGVGIETGTGYTPGVGIQPDTADMPHDEDR